MNCDLDTIMQVATATEWSPTKGWCHLTSYLNAIYEAQVAGTPVAEVYKFKLGRLEVTGSDVIISVQFKKGIVPGKTASDNPTCFQLLLGLPQLHDDPADFMHYI